jgi:membrane-bound lytic murein transglycosylase D
MVVRVLSGMSGLKTTVPAVLVLVWVCAACSPGETVPPEHGPLYDRIREYRADYERGLQVILDGDPVTGENLLAAASKRLSVAAQECARTPDCDTRLFSEAMRHLLEERRLANAGGPDDVAAESSLVRAIPELERTVALLHGTDLREMIPMNAPVKAALNRWLTRDREQLLEAWENYQYLRPQIAPIYDASELPEALLFAILAEETGAKVHAYSRAGAAGPLQFMPRTALRYGLRTVDGFDSRLDPVASTRANAAYLRDQFRALNDDLEKVLAAYNGGESRVRRLDRKHGGAEFWDPSFYYSLPRETRGYVPDVLAAVWLFLHPEEYGLDFPTLEATTTTIRVEEAVSLDELTVCLGQAGNPRGWYRTLRNLNPRLRGGERVPALGTVVLPTGLVEAHAERCVGDAPPVRLARDLYAAAHPERPDALEYTVRQGDTLAAIASRHRVTLSELASLNGLSPPHYVIHVGQRLTVPRG